MSAGVVAGVVGWLVCAPALSQDCGKSGRGRGRCARKSADELIRQSAEEVFSLRETSAALYVNSW